MDPYAEYIADTEPISDVRDTWNDLTRFLLKRAPSGSPLVLMYSGDQLMEYSEVDQLDALIAAATAARDRLVAATTTDSP